LSDGALYRFALALICREELCLLRLGNDAAEAGIFLLPNSKERLRPARFTPRGVNTRVGEQTACDASREKHEKEDEETAHSG
jgi:hypothetical protein